MKLRLIILATRLDNRLRERQREKAEGRRSRFSSPASSPHQQFPASLRTSSDRPGEAAQPPLDAEEPMQLGRARLTPAETTFSPRLMLLLWPGRTPPGQVSSSAKRGGSSASRGALVSCISPNSTPPRSKRIQVQGMLRWSHDTLPIQVLIDPGADDSFIDYELVSQAYIPTIALSEPQEVLALDGKQLVRVTHQTEPISLTLSGKHHKLIELFVISMSSQR